MADKILIIDDDSRICRIVKSVADHAGFESEVIDDAKLFDCIYNRFRPSVIIIDLLMPEVDGVEILRRLSTQHSSASIIILSGADKAVVQTSLELGRTLGLNMAGILSKPFHFEELESLLVHQVETSAASPETPIIDPAELERAVVNREFVVHFQPQFDIIENRIKGAEALVRWQHPQHGLLFPDAFIPMAEREEAVIERMTFQVFEDVLDADREFEVHGIRPQLSVNLSSCLLSDLELPDRIVHLLHGADFDPKRLTIEVTESGALDEPTKHMDILTRLRLKDINLSIDDFGTGYSSLTKLYQLPFNEIKLDKSFVMAATTKYEAATIVQTSLALGHSLDLTVVAEGVEDLATLSWLRQLKCDIGQGYYFSRPVDKATFTGWCTKHGAA